MVRSCLGSPHSLVSLTLTRITLTLTPHMPHLVKRISLLKNLFTPELRMASHMLVIEFTLCFHMLDELLTPGLQTLLCSTVHTSHTTILHWLMCAPWIIYNPPPPAHVSLSLSLLLLLLFFCTYFTWYKTIWKILAMTLLTHALCRVYTLLCLCFHRIYTESTPCAACALQWVCICLVMSSHFISMHFTQRLQVLYTELCLVYIEFIHVLQLFSNNSLLTWAVVVLHVGWTVHIFIMCSQRFTHRLRMSLS